MKNHLLLILFLVTIFPESSYAIGGSEPEYRACLYHHQIYAIVRWNDSCDPSLVDNGIFRASNHHAKKINAYVKYQDIVFIRKNKFTKVEVPHDPACFSTEPYY